MSTSPVGPLAFADLDGELFLSNDAAYWAILDRPSAEAFFAGRLGPEHPRHALLLEGGFLRAGLDPDAHAARIRRRMASVWRGTHLHIFVLSLRCDLACRYCHASRLPAAAQGGDMSLQTARDAVDLAFRSPSPALNFEFQGGEPLENPEVMRFVLDYARERNRHERRELRFSLVSNFSRMSEDKLDWLVAEDLAVCTSLDGPADLHDDNRRALHGGSSHAQVTHWIRRFNEAYAERGWDPRAHHVEALLTATRATLGRAEEVVQAFLDAGLPSLHLRPLNPYGFAAAAWDQIGYPVEDYLRFYFAALDEVLRRNREGIDLREQTAAVHLTRLLSGEDPGHLDLRSPCGAGIGQLAYDHDGTVYSCDEGRMLARGGDRAFALGDVKSDFRSIVGHPTVRAMVLASTLEALPGCADCAWRPFCGVCPIHSWATEGDLFGQRPRSARCRLQMGQLQGLVRRLRDDEDGSTTRIFRRWTQRHRA